MVQEVLNESGLEGIVLVKDTYHQMTSTLTTAAFMSKLQLLRDIIQVSSLLNNMKIWKMRL